MKLSSNSPWHQIETTLGARRYTLCTKSSSACGAKKPLVPPRQRSCPNVRNFRTALVDDDLRACKPKREPDSRKATRFRQQPTESVGQKTEMKSKRVRRTTDRYIAVMRRRIHDALVVLALIASSNCAKRSMLALDMYAPPFLMCAVKSGCATFAAPPREDTSATQL